MWQTLQPLQIIYSKCNYDRLKVHSYSLRHSAKSSGFIYFQEMSGTSVRLRDVVITLSGAEFFPQLVSAGAEGRATVVLRPAPL